MTTALEIIDTAVKIGLGALISGLASYWVVKEKNKHDMEKDSAFEKRALLKEITIKVEVSSDLLAEFMHTSFSNNLEELGAKKSKLIEASNVSGNAAALANMIGYSSLSNAINKYHGSALKFHNHLAGNLKNIDNDETNTIINEINENLRLIQPLLSAAYECENA